MGMKMRGESDDLDDAEPDHVAEVDPRVNSRHVEEARRT